MWILYKGKPLDDVEEEVIKDNIFIYTKELDDENIAEIFVMKIKKIAKTIYETFYLKKKILKKTIKTKSDIPKHKMLLIVIFARGNLILIIIKK